jgi:hypothetical protein
MPGSSSYFANTSRSKGRSGTTMLVSKGEGFTARYTIRGA